MSVKKDLQNSRARWEKKLRRPKEEFLGFSGVTDSPRTRSRRHTIALIGRRGGGAGFALPRER